MNAAIKTRNVEAVKFLIENNVECPSYSIELASGNNDLKMVRYLHNKFIFDGLGAATRNKNLEVIVYFLKQNEECIDALMREPSPDGHLQTFIDLNNIYFKFTTSNVTDSAAKYGHIFT